MECMDKPVILVVDPEPEVLWAIKNDMQRMYSNAFQVLRSDSDKNALEKLKQLQKQNNSATLFVVEQQSSEMAGMVFLKAVMEMFPKAKQFLLTAYDTDDISSRLPVSRAVVI